MTSATTEDIALKSAETMKRKHCVLFGFKGADEQDTTGYLRIETDKKDANYGGIYSIVSSVNEATKFPSMNYDNKPGFWSPAKICEFMLLEEELEPWVFHPVPVEGF